MTAIKVGEIYNISDRQVRRIASEARYTPPKSRGGAHNVKITAEMSRFMATTLLEFPKTTRKDLRFT
jgi:hypothetical protein